jgi:hypothetical protein
MPPQVGPWMGDLPTKGAASRARVQADRPASTGRLPLACEASHLGARRGVQRSTSPWARRSG